MTNTVLAEKERILNSTNDIELETIVIDKENKIITSPAYMLGKSISEVAEGIEETVRELVAMV